MTMLMQSYQQNQAQWLLITWMGNQDQARQMLLLNAIAGTPNQQFQLMESVVIVQENVQQKCAFARKWQFVLLQLFLQ
jgi:DNA polymerase IIIc chi subunit